VLLKKRDMYEEESKKEALAERALKVQQAKERLLARKSLN
jgi:hypothetical protein